MSFLDDWKEWSTAKKAISIIVVCCIGLIIIGLITGSFSPDKNTSSPPETIKVSDIAISSTGYGGYDVSCKLVPDKDYSYLEAQVIFYDSEGAVIEKCPLVWNMNDVKADQTIKVSGNAYISGDDTPVKAKLLFFDNALSGDDSKAIFTQDVSM